MAFMKRAVRRQKAFKADVVLLELDTPGGNLLDAEAMSRDLTGLAPTPTVCFIRPMAMSAGVYLTISCDRVYMSPTGTVGASTPYRADAQGMSINLPEDLKKKNYRALEGVYRALAQKKGYDAGLVDATVDPDAEPVLVAIDGEKMILTASALSERREKMLAEAGGDAVSRQSAVEGRIKVLKPFKKGPLVLTAEEAAEVGFAHGIVNDREALLNALGLVDPVVEVMSPNWSEVVFGFLSSPVISGLLLAAGLIGLYIELKTPGFGVPGILGIVCIGLLIFSHFLVGLADYTDLIILGVGILLLGIELFVTPGFGLLGTAGIILIVVGIFLSGQSFGLPKQERFDQWEAFKVNLMVVSLSLIAFLASAIVLAKLLPGIPFLNRLVLKTAGPGSGEELVGSAGTTKTDVSVGAVGEALSMLRPAGRARFGDKVLDVMTQGEFIEMGRAIEVLETKGNRILVRAIREAGEESPE